MRSRPTSSGGRSLGVQKVIRSETPRITGVCAEAALFEAKPNQNRERLAQSGVVSVPARLQCFDIHLLLGDGCEKVEILLRYFHERMVVLGHHLSTAICGPTHGRFRHWICRTDGSQFLIRLPACFSANRRLRMSAGLRALKFSSSCPEIRWFAATLHSQPQTSLQPVRSNPILPSTNSKCPKAVAARADETRSSCLRDVFQQPGRLCMTASWDS